MKRIHEIFIVLVMISLCSCTHLADLKEGQCVVNETQVEGIDLSIPIPFVENVALFNFRFGFIQNKVYKGYKVPYISNSYYRDLSLIKGEGSVARSLVIGIPQDNNSIFKIKTDDNDDQK